MVKKKLNYAQILDVVSLHKGTHVRMQALPSAPEWEFPEVQTVYVPVGDGILLPKRRRGERFYVRYTKVCEVEL